MQNHTENTFNFSSSFVQQIVFPALQQINFPALQQIVFPALAMEPFIILFPAPLTNDNKLWISPPMLN